MVLVNKQQAITSQIVFKILFFLLSDIFNFPKVIIIYMFYKFFKCVAECNKITFISDVWKCSKLYFVLSLVDDKHFITTVGTNENNPGKKLAAISFGIFCNFFNLDKYSIYLSNFPIVPIGGTQKFNIVFRELT